MPGPQGPPGPQGDEGDPGPTGPPGTTTWAGITDKPATFPPDAHGHPQSDIVNLIADLALKAPLASPVFTGDPRGPTPAAADNDTSLATTAWVTAKLAALPASPTPAGTQMLFLQSTAPTGWTKIVAWNDCALRVVNGTSGGSFFGSSNFSSVFGRTATDATTITSSTMGVAAVGMLTASHASTGFSALAGTGPWGHDSGYAGKALYSTAANNNEGVQVGGASHVHTIDMRVTYLDAMPAYKN